MPGSNNNSTFLGSLSSAAGTALGGLPGTIIGGIAGNLLGGLFGGSSEKKSFKYQTQLMEQQQKYNLQNAKVQQQYNKEMWDYTNSENQVKHLKAAGLNPALIYGMNGGGGAGGQSSSGASVSGVGMPSGNAVAMGLQAKQIQADMINAQANMTAATANANKANADADKTRGVDTAKAWEEIELLKKEQNYKGALTKLTDATEKETIAHKNLYESQTRLTDQEMRNKIQENNKILRETAILGEELKAKKMQNKITEATMDEQIRQVALNNGYLIAKTLSEYGLQSLQEAQIEELGARVTYLGVSGEAQKTSSDAFASQAEGQIQRWATQNDIDTKMLTQEQIRTAIKAFDSIVNAVDVGSSLITRGLQKLWRKEKPKSDQADKPSTSFF